MNLSLIGYRGTGKSTIAKILALRTARPVVNLDAAIVQAAGMSIPEIVERHGWDYFRDLESQVLEQALRHDRQILDCGGGIILRPQNRRKLKQAGPVVWLTAPVPVIVARIKDDTQRPSLTGKSFIEEVEEVLAEREPLYRQCADHVIPTDSLSPEEAADKILELTGWPKANKLFSRRKG